MAPLLFRVTSAEMRGAPYIWHIKTLESKADELAIIDAALAGTDPKTLFRAVEKPIIEFDPDKGTRWPAAIGGRTLGNDIRFIVHETVAETLKKTGSYAGECRPIEFSNLPRKLRNQETPNYYQLLPDVYIPVETRQMGHIDGSEMSDYQQLVAAGPIDSPPPILARTQPNGGLILGSLEFIHLARENGWKNFQFEPFNAISGRAVWRLERGIVDYLGKDFPPENWYPSHQEKVLSEFGPADGFDSKS